jgi:iron complex outermembrane recepter protein
MTRTIRSALFIATLTFPGLAEAQSIDYAALEQLFGEPVTNSATGSPQRESQVPATMIIITAEDIRRSGARDIPGVLQHVVGVSVLQTSNDYADVSVRGYNQAFAPRLLVLVDGRQVYADYYGFTPWSSVAVELGSIRQIEVVKGPNSALFGFNAVAGVINIITYDPNNDDVDTVSLSAGTQGLVQGSIVSTWKPSDSIGILLSAGHREGDDFSSPLQPADAGVRRGNERNAVNLGIEWEASDHLQYAVEATYSDARQAELAPLYTMVYNDYETNSIKGSAIADTQIGLLQATVYSNQITSRSFLPGVSGIWLTARNRVSVAQLQSISKIAKQHTLRLSAEYRHNTMATTPVPGGDVFYDVAAFGSTWEWQLDPSITLTTAVRLDHWSLGRTGSVPPGYPLTNEDWDRSQTEPSFNVGVVWQASEVDTLRFLAGRGVQLPNLVNLGGLVLPLPFPPGGFASGVPDLDPTIVENYEISWDRALSSIDAQLRVSAFNGRSRDIVAVTGGARPSEGLFGLPMNIGNSTTAGLEISLHGTLRDEWRWGMSYRGQEIDDDFAAGSSVGVTLTDFENTTPRHVLKANVGWTRDRWEADAYVRYLSRFEGVLGVAIGGAGTAQLVPIPSHAAMDVRVAYAVNDRIAIELSGRNIASSMQRQTSAPDVERAVFATFAMTFGSAK